MNLPTLAYLGPSGSFSEEAAIKFSQNAYKLEQYNTVYAALNATENGRTDCALMPIENALGGSIVEVEDHLLDPSTKLRIVAECLITVNLCLIGRVNNMGEVRAVRSKAEAFQQCRRFLRAELPNAALEPWHSTSGAVDSITGGDAPLGTLVIASRAAADKSGLPIIKEAVQDSGAVNLTRFVLLAKDGPCSKGEGVKTSLVFSFLNEDSPGQLVKVLEAFYKAGVNLTKIASRPTRTKLGSYYFWVDFEGHQDGKDTRAILAYVATITDRLKILGSYRKGDQLTA